MVRVSVNTLKSSAFTPEVNDALAKSTAQLYATYAKMQTTNQLLGTIEVQLNIQERWGPDHPEFMKYKSEVDNSDYRKALDALERVVVMRLFELTKLNMSGTGASITFSL